MTNGKANDLHSMIQNLDRRVSQRNFLWLIISLTDYQSLIYPIIYPIIYLGIFSCPWASVIYPIIYPIIYLGIFSCPWASVYVIFVNFATELVEPFWTSSDFQWQETGLIRSFKPSCGYSVQFKLNLFLISYMIVLADDVIDLSWRWGRWKLF